MPVTLPFDLTVPTKREIKAGELMADYQSLADKFSAGIVDADCSTTMNLNGNKIATNSIPANRIIDGSVNSVQLAPNSVGLSQMQDAAVGTAELVDLAVNLAKLGPSSVNLSKMLLNVGTIAFSAPFPTIVAGGQQVIDLNVASGTGFTNSFVVGNGAIGHVLALWWNSGVAPTIGSVSGDYQMLSTTIHKDVVTAGTIHWYIRLTNPHSANVTSASLTPVSLSFALII